MEGNPALCAVLGNSVDAAYTCGSALSSASAYSLALGPAGPCSC